MERERWGTRLGVIMAVAGSAIGLGNFLRFPVQAAKNGGGAFMIPYFAALFLLGIPLMWIEWTIGRFGGGFGHGTAPGIFHSMAEKRRFIKYFGVIGIFGPLVIFIYYTYIESWLLGYSLFALLGTYERCSDRASMTAFLAGYQGLARNEYFGSMAPAYGFFAAAFLLNIAVVARGIRGGIERLCNAALPVLFVLGIAVMVRILTLPPPVDPAWTASAGLGFLWNPDLSALRSARVWLAAAGQIFFTLSVGIGVILTYASYLKKEDAIVLPGLTAASSNELAEVILGGSIAIPAAFLFFGPVGVGEVASGGSFNLGFVTMPLVLKLFPLGRLFGFCWFFLLFLAGITSSVSLAQPAISFLEDEFGFSRRKAVAVFGAVSFVLMQIPVFLLGRGALDELDFWGGTFALVVFATVETILFGWVFGMDRAWDELHAGSDLRLPRVYKFIIKYVTPGLLLCILGAWVAQEGLPVIRMAGVPPENVPCVAGVRALLVGMLLVLCLLVWRAWRGRDKEGA